MTSERPWLKPLLLVIAVVVGVGSAAQSRINGSLAEAIASGVHAAAISFGTGLLLLLVVLLVRQQARAGLRRVAAAVRAGALPWWGLLGGACGATMVLSQGLAVPFVGVAVFMTSTVIGQLLGSLAVDHFGWLGAPRHRISWMRAVGAMVAVIAVGLVGLGAGLDLASIGLVLLCVFGGFLIALQLGITGTVRLHAGESVSPTVLNFVVGFVILAAAALVGSLAGWVQPGPLPSDWWMYLGGAIGVVYVFMVASVVRGLGVFLLSLSLVGGQLLGSLLFDLLAAHFSWLLLFGVLLAFVGVTIAQLGARRAEA